MIRVFKAPFVSRNKVSNKLAAKVIVTMLLVVASMFPLFYFVDEDARVYAGEIQKGSPYGIEISVVIVFATAIAAVIYLTVVGIKVLRSVRMKFIGWAYYKGKLYNITAAPSSVYAGKNSRRLTKTMSFQDEAIRLLNDSYTLMRFLDGEIYKAGIFAYEVRAVQIKRENKKGARVLLPDGREVFISADMQGYENLMSILNSLRMH